MKTSISVHKIGIYPLSKYYIDQLDMLSIFDKYLPKIKGSPLLSECLCVLIQNIVLSPKPLYQIQDWLKSYADGQGEYGHKSHVYTDDRLGQCLDELYACDRQSLMMEISSTAIRVHELETTQIHTDTTSISLSGAYSEQSEEGVQLKRGHNKDHRPNCKQIIFGLNTTSDGYIPLHLQLYDGNTTDDQTHIVNWNEVRFFLKKTDFCYVAYSKAATKKNMAHISSNGGHFISLLPASRKETTDFKTLLRSSADEVRWQYLAQNPTNRTPSQVTTYRYFEGTPTSDGFRLIWIHSSAKATIDGATRQRNLVKIGIKLEEITNKLNRYKLKTKTQIEEAIGKIIKGYEPFFNVQIEEHQTFITKKLGRGRPHANSQYIQIPQVHYTLNYKLKEDIVKSYQQQDGIFPLVTNTKWKAEKVFKTYKEQPYLEKRFSTLKSVLEVMPIFLKKTKRIEAMLLVYFFALMVVSLMERRIRKNMKEQEVQALPILPQKMKTKTPTINNIRYFFRDTILLAIKNITGNKQQINFIMKGFSKLHQKILKLLDVPLAQYNIKELNWWKFQPV